ncbi:PilW family protein [Crenothrix sp.]|uniref:PilW family protein n=1 Tax=Crenothrix sp. TaxID=3100433 RepID=UPI00374D0CB2
MNKQHGMSLVELMISLVLSLTVIAGISSLFLHMKKTNQIQRAMATMADDSSYVQEVLQKEIRRTGGLRSPSDTNGGADKIFLWSDNVLGPRRNFDLLGMGLKFEGEEYIKGDATSPANDAFLIRYQLLDAQDLSANFNTVSSNSNSPCTQNILSNPLDQIDPLVFPVDPLNSLDPALVGDPESVPHVVSIYFYLRPDLPNHPNDLILSCTAQRERVNTAATTATCIKNCTSTSNFTPNPAINPVDLINNVVKFEVSYGVDPGADGSADYYVDAATIPVGSPELWLDIVSVRLSFVIRSEEKFLRNDPPDPVLNPPVAYTLNGVPHPPPVGDQRQLYKVFTTTIALRNHLL